ncbi:MAG: anti-sigma factor RsiW [Myxococcota bacterium]|jgi:anti-sigma factor RsiW
MTAHLNTLTLHQLRYGELDDTEEADARAHLATCELCSERLGAQQAERAAFEAMPVPEAIRNVPAAPTPANNNRNWVIAVALIAVAAAVVLTVFIQPWTSAPTGTVIGAPIAQGIDGIRSKGAEDAIVVQAFKDTADGPVAIESGGHVRVGDRIQLKVRRPPAPWVTIAGVDGSGEAVVYGSWQPEADDWEPAPFGLTMDDTPGKESIYAVFTDTEPNRAALRATLLDNHRSDVPADNTSWQVIILDKVP